MTKHSKPFLPGRGNQKFRLVWCYLLFVYVASICIGPTDAAKGLNGTLRQQEAGLLEIHSRKKTVLVTGAAGFVGSHVADALLQRGDKVIIMDEVNDYYNVSIKEANLRYLINKHGNKNLKIYRGDVANETFVDMVFATEKPKWICHLAARAGVRPSIENPFIYIHSNVLGTVRLMDAAVRYKVRNFVYASSSSVYGGSSESFFDESQPVDHPISPYAATKKITELFAYTWQYLYNLPTTSLRFFTVYGPRGRPDMAPFLFIDSVRRGLSLAQYGNGSSSRDYTYIDDIVDGVIRSIDRPYRYQIFNLGKGDGTKLSDFIRLVEAKVNKTAQIKYLEDQPGDVPYTCANVSKANTFLGYEPHTRFEEGISKTVEWFQEAYPLDEGRESKGLDGPSTEATEQRQTNERRRLSVPEPLVHPFGFNSRRFRRQLRVLQGMQNEESFNLSWQNETILEPHKGKKRVLVTGAAGFIGSHVADYLLHRGDEVIVVDEVNDYYDVSIKEGNLKLLEGKYGTTNRLKIYRGDIANQTLMERIFQEEKPDWICHMAARAGVRPSIDDPYVYIHSNIVGTTRLLSLANDYQVKNFVFASSSSVYGGSKSTYFSEEESVIHPISPYAASKKACELLSYTFHHLYNIPVTSLRFFTVYGPRGRPDMAPFMFVDRVSRGKALPQFGDGTSSRDYTYIDDIVDGVVRAVDRPYPYQVFNLGKGGGTKLSDFIRLVEKYTGLKANITILPDQPGDVPYTCADVRKAEYLLGYRPKVPFEEGIKRTVEWYLEAYPRQTKAANDDTIQSGSSALTVESPLVPGKANDSSNVKVSKKKDIPASPVSSQSAPLEKKSNVRAKSKAAQQQEEIKLELFDENKKVLLPDSRGKPESMTKKKNKSSVTRNEMNSTSTTSQGDYFVKDDSQERTVDKTQKIKKKKAAEVTEEIPMNWFERNLSAIEILTLILVILSRPVYKRICREKVGMDTSNGAGRGARDKTERVQLKVSQTTRSATALGTVKHSRSRESSPVSILSGDI